MPHGNHRLNTESNMDMSTMCTYPSSNYSVPHWKHFLRCFTLCPKIDLPIPESDQHNSHVSRAIYFHVYQQTAH